MPRGFLRGGGVEVGFRLKRIIRGHCRGADDPSGDMIGPPASSALVTVDIYDLV